MRILVGCEESQAITKAFRKRGHEAYSCDLKDCSGGHPEWHIKGDVMDAIQDFWDLIILHPDCTAMAVCGNKKYAVGMESYQERIEAIQWTVKLWKRALLWCDRVALENPVSVIFQYLEDKEMQYIQPWQFGHGETKKTGLALHNLPKLIPTDIVEGREQRIWKMAPSPDRKEKRSKTYEGIAEAIAEQWGNLIQKGED